jgi:hypothetical protein
MAVICVIVPVRAVSVANMREHWRRRAARAKLHRDTTRWVLAPHRVPNLPCTITLTRIAPRRLDSDNCTASLKACRDGAADWLGVDDGDRRLTWVTAQRRGGVKEYGVEVSIQGTNGRA